MLLSFLYSFFCCRILALFTKLRDVFSFLLHLSVSSKFYFLFLLTFYLYFTNLESTDVLPATNEASAASDNATFSNETGDSNTTVFNTTVESDISMSNDTVYSSITNASFNRISIPAIAFRNVTDNKTGVIFSLYATDILFPLRLNQSQNDTYKAIGSSVLSGTVAGENIQGLKQPINISMSIIVSVS
jgi:uncharacterized protein (UPF0333 family)